jgi:hypothetical protein
MKRASLAATLLLVAGCSATEGLIHEPPAPTSPNPADITIYRESNPEAAIAPMVFTINGTEIYGLRPGGSFEFRLDPGSYVFGWYLGMNNCSQTVFINSGAKIRLPLSPICNIPPEPGF